ncbi:unnamed protein product, partial [Ectocarpus sp. 4 AP-2014]
CAGCNQRNRRDLCWQRRGWCYDILRAAEIPATNTKKKVVITVEHLEGDAKQRLLVTKMVEALKEKGITLQRHDKNEFDPGDWYGNSYYHTKSGNLQAGFVELIA